MSNILVLITTLLVIAAPSQVRWLTTRVNDHIHVSRFAGRVAITLGGSGEDLRYPGQTIGLADWIVMVRDSRNGRVISRRITSNDGKFDCGRLRTGSYQLELTNHRSQTRYIGVLQIHPAGTFPDSLLIRPLCESAGNDKKCELLIFTTPVTP